MRKIIQRLVYKKISTLPQTTKTMFFHKTLALIPYSLKTSVFIYCICFIRKQDKNSVKKNFWDSSCASFQRDQKFSATCNFVFFLFFLPLVCSKLVYNAGRNSTYKTELNVGKSGKVWLVSRDFFITGRTTNCNQSLKLLMLKLFIEVCLSKLMVQFTRSFIVSFLTLLTFIWRRRNRFIHIRALN